MSGWTDVFSDVLKATGSTANWGPEEFGKVMHEAGKKGWLTRHVVNDREYHELISSSDRITTTLMFDAKKDGSFHNPGVPRPRNNPQFLATSNIEYAYQDQPVVWLDQEVILNQGGDMNDRRTRYADLAKAKMMRGFTSMFEVMEDSAFAVPNATTMETVAFPTVRVPYSIFAFANESAAFSITTTVAAQTAALTAHDGLFRGAAAGALTSGWTTVAGIAGTEARWRNQLFEYRHASTTGDGVDAGGNNMYDGSGIVRAFNDAFLNGDFETPTANKGEFKLDDVRRQHILSGLRGMNLWLRVSAAAGSSLAMRYTNQPDVYGVPMVRIEAMDTAEVYPNSALTGLVGPMAGVAPSGGATSATNAACWGPRFIFWNTPKCHPKFHKERFMQMIDEYKVQGAEDTHVNVYSSWWNWCPESRQRLVTVRGNLSSTTSAGV